MYFGGTSPDSAADLTVTGTGAGDRFGDSVGGAGDVNGDGFSDVIVGETDGGSGNEGRAYVFLGGPAVDAIADLTLVR